MKNIHSHLRLQRGLTLTELVVAMAVAGILLAGGYGIFLAQQKTYAVQNQVAEMQQNARAAMNMLTRDLRMAGHGVPDLWSVDINGNTYSSTVTADGTTVTLLGCFGPPGGYLATSAGKGDTQIFLVNDKQLENFDDSHTGDRSYIFIGEYDKALVTDINYDDNTLTIDTDPALPENQGLKKRYPTTRLSASADSGDNQIRVLSTANILAGDILTLGDERLYVTDIAGNTISFSRGLLFGYPRATRVNPIPVYFVQALQYNLRSDGVVTRHDLWARGQRTRLAENIRALNVTQTDLGPYRITLTARTGVPDETGKFRSRTYCFTVRVRNRM